MPEPIGKYSPEAVIEAIEDNLVGASTSLGRTEEGVVFRGSDVTWVYTGHGSLSRVLRARFRPDAAEGRVAEIFDCFRAWDAPVSWVVGPTTYPPKLGEVLQDSGFDTGEVWTGLARDVPAADLPADEPPLPSTFRISRATTEPDLASWADLGGDITPPDLFAPGNAGGDPRCRYYLATIDGRPVARGMAYQTGDVVGLHWFTVAAQHRGRGYARAIVRDALTAARGAGSRLAVLHARGEHQLRLGNAMGFRPYCQFRVHAWPPAPPRPV